MSALGILIAKSKKQEVIEYALRTSTQPLAVSTYSDLPPQMRALLPSAADLSRIVDDVLAGEDVAEPPSDGTIEY